MYGHRIDTERWDIMDKKLYDKLYREFDRIVKNNGGVIIFTRAEYISWALESAIRNNFDVKATIVWHKTNPIPQIRKKNYLSSVENILWVARWNDNKCDFTFNFKTQKEMHNFIEMPICGGNERTIHPTQKPIKLIKHLLQIHSNKNDLVLDPFLGSGTTAVACKELGRRYIGIEINPEYCEIARNRLKAISEPLF
jgi:site-specific DNA-methyltransferase (adenine-specific)/modification methylase